MAVMGQIRGGAVGGGSSYELIQNVPWAANSNFTLATSKRATGFMLYGTGSTNKKVFFSNYYNGDFSDSSIHRYDNNDDISLTITDNLITIQTQWASSVTYFDAILLYD